MSEEINEPINNPLDNPQYRNLKPVKPGEVRNPNGRPKGSLNTRTIIRKILQSKEKVIDPRTKKPRLMTQLEIMALKQLEKARKGDTRAAEFLLNRMDGMPTQAVQQLDENGNPAAVSAIRQVIVVGGKEIEF